MANRGLFISFEGPDGSGKTSMIKKLEEKLHDDYKDVKICLTREPGGTSNAIAEDIRNILLNKTEYNIDYYAEALLFAASRAQHVHDFIKPNLDSGNIVITDRYVDSNIVYQGYGRGLGAEAIWKLNEFAMHGVLPDLTLILMVSPEIGLERIFSNELREVNRLDKEKHGLHEKVYDAYRKIIDGDTTGRIVEVDASGTPNEVFDKVYAIIKDKISNISK